MEVAATLPELGIPQRNGKSGRKNSLLNAGPD
jgi:hypothetical protein